jgi:hypothetical protein
MHRLNKAFAFRNRSFWKATLRILTASSLPVLDRIARVRAFSLPRERALGALSASNPFEVVFDARLETVESACCGTHMRR